MKELEDGTLIMGEEFGCFEGWVIVAEAWDLSGFRLGVPNSDEFYRRALGATDS